MLEKEYGYYQDHKRELVAAYRGKFLVIADDQVIGVYADIGSALAETVKTRAMGTFLIQQALPDEDIVQRFHSRVIIGAA